MDVDRNGVAQRARYRCPRFRQCLQPGSYIDAIPVDIILLSDYVAEIDTHAKLDAPFLGQFGLAVNHLALDLNGPCIGSLRNAAGSSPRVTPMAPTSSERNSAIEPIRRW